MKLPTTDVSFKLTGETPAKVATSRTYTQIISSEVVAATLHKLIDEITEECETNERPFTRRAIVTVALKQLPEQLQDHLSGEYLKYLRRTQQKYSSNKTFPYVELAKYRDDWKVELIPGSPRRYRQTYTWVAGAGSCSVSSSQSSDQCAGIEGKDHVTAN
jgi:hypothetical protein